MWLSCGVFVELGVVVGNDLITLGGEFLGFGFGGIDKVVFRFRYGGIESLV